MKLIDLTRINQLIDDILDKINDKYATKAELNSGLKGKAEANHGTHLTLGNTQNSAYRGDYGNAAYQHSQAAHAPSNAQKNSDITKAEIEAKLTGTISSHTHSDIYSPTSHNHTSLTGLTSLTFAANSDDSSIIKITKDSATSYTDFVMSDDIGSDMWRWRFKAWDPVAAANTAEYDLMTLKATSTTKGQLSINGNITADSFTEGGTALSSKYAAASHGTHLTIGTGASNAAAGNHTHKYAGSSSAGGTANSAAKLDMARVAGSSNSANYAPGASSLVAREYGPDCTNMPSAHWYHIYTGQGSDANYNTQLAVGMTTDGLYFRNKNTGTWGSWKKASVDGHTHNYAGSSSAGGAANSVKTNLVVKLNGGSTEGTNLFTFNGSTAKTVNITASNIGAAPSSSIGTLSSLQTSAKGNLVAAINELFQNANNGKQLIANAIGDSGLTSNSTFSAMSNAITDKRDRLYNLMLDGGYEVNSGMNMDSLLDLLELSGIGVNDIKQIACGAYHTVILKKDGSVYACGSNGGGQLGSGDTTSNATLTKITTNVNNDVKQIACGGQHTFILKNDGSLWSCGECSYGQLGVNDIYNKYTLTKVTTNVNNDVKEVVCGYDHTFILKNDGTVYSCGDNYYGQLGIGSTRNQKTTFTKVNINNVKKIVCGSNHSFILKNDGSVWSCGNGNDGQLGLSLGEKTTFTKVTTNINNDVKEIACGGSHTFIIKNDGSLWCCGANGEGQLGIGSGYSTGKSDFTQVTTNINNDVKQVACGSDYTLIIKNDGSVWGCGYNNYGQLGLGSTSTGKYLFAQVTKNVNNDVKEIICGHEHTLMLKNDGSVWSCGYNGSGQLGLGTSGDKNASLTEIPRGF